MAQPTRIQSSIRLVALEDIGSSYESLQLSKIEFGFRKSDAAVIAFLLGIHLIVLETKGYLRFSLYPAPANLPCHERLYF